MIELIGIIGGGLFAAGCIPMAWATVRLGKDVGTPLITQWLLLLACLFYSVYLFSAFGFSHLPFWFLAIEVVCWGIAVWYHYFPRRVVVMTLIEQMAKQHWDDNGPCAPQCYAECDGVCSAELDRLNEQATIFSATCIRQHDDGPCNGLPRPECPGYSKWLEGVSK